MMPAIVENVDTTPFLVPTVDIGPFLASPDSSAARSVVDSVRRACTTSGFFQVTGHGLPENVQRELFRASKKFFDLPQEEKNKLDAKTTVGRRGYDVLASQSYHDDVLPDLKEGFYVGHDVPLDDPVVKERRFFMGPNVWPERSHLAQQDFQAPVEAYFQAVHSLALRVLELIACTLPYGPRIFDKFTEGHTVAVLRLLHYPPAPKDSSKQLGAGAHTDFGAITLLLQDENPGLEVLDPKSNEFVAVNPTPNAFVFNVGDMLSFWTGSEYKSSVHRVINKAPKDRYSAAFFYDGALDCLLTPLNSNGLETVGEETYTVEKHMIKRIMASYGPQEKKRVTGVKQVD
jgi:isopenicillin N synthase-like dioxygenase